MKTTSILLSVILLFTACSTTSPPENTATCSIDYEARELIREWNNLSAQLLASYMDMAIPVDQVINDLGSLNPQLRRVVREMRALQNCLSPEEAEFFEPFAATYNDKLSGYSALENALRIGSIELEDNALEMLTVANNASLKMVCDFEEMIEEKLPGADLC